MDDQQLAKLLLMLDAIRIAILASIHPDGDVAEEEGIASDKRAEAAFEPPVRIGPTPSPY